MGRLPSRSRLLHVAGLLVLVAVLVPAVVVAVPQVAGADHSFVILSGSMEPAIGTGDVVLVSEVAATRIAAGDVIVYTDDRTRVTHRVVEVVEHDGDRRFRTKGDANEDADSELVPPARVVGRVTTTVPYLGRLLSWAGTRLGMVALVALPLGLLVADELRRLAGGMRTEQDDERGRFDR